MNLNPKMKIFCAEYLIDLNATKAAERAKYSKKTARSIGQRLLTNVDIQKEIQRLMNKRSERTEITQDRVLKELAILGFSNIKNYVDASTKGFVSFKDIEKIPEEQARAIESIKVNYKEGRIEFKLHSKTKTIEMICRHLGMFIDKIEHSGSIKANLSISDLKDSIKNYENGSGK